MGELIPTQEILLIYTQEHMVVQSSLVIARCGTRIHGTYKYRCHISSASYQEKVRIRKKRSSTMVTRLYAPELIQSYVVGTDLCEMNFDL
jgi:hypothetical protein